MFNIENDTVKGNLKLNNQEFAQKKVVLESFPVSVQMSPTERCNLMCFHCYRQKWKNELYEKDMPLDILERDCVNQAMSKATAGWIVSGGEPFLYKCFKDLVDCFDKSGITTTYTITNGTVYSTEFIKYLVSVYFTFIKVSIDGAKMETVEKIRGKNVFNRIMRFVEEVNVHKKNIGATYPEIIFSMVLMKNNFLELPELIELANNTGIKYVEAHHCQNLNDNVSNMSVCDMEEELKDVIEKSEDLAKKYHMCFTHPLAKDSEELNRNHEENYGCSQPWNFFLINQIGEVFPCCHLWGNSFGNVYNRTFQGIWNGKEFVQLRADIANKGFSDMCLKSECPKIKSIKRKVCKRK